MDREAFRARFKAYKEGKPVSEIYDAGLPRYADGKDDALFRAFQATLPYNQRNTPEFMYPTRRYWELNGRPKDFSEAVGKGMYTYNTSDNYWHANSVQYNESTNEYELMKPNWHNTKMMEDAWYYSKDGEDFRNSYIKQPGIIYDKYIPKANNNSRIHIGLKDGKLPKFLEGKDSDLVKLLKDDPGFISSWDIKNPNPKKQRAEIEVNNSSDGGYTKKQLKKNESVHKKWDPTSRIDPVSGALNLIFGGNEAKGEEDQYWRAYLGLSNDVPTMNPKDATYWDKEIEDEVKSTRGRGSDFYGITPRMKYAASMVADTLNLGKLVRAGESRYEGLYNTAKKILNNPYKYQQVEDKDVEDALTMPVVNGEYNPLGMLANFGIMWDPDELKLYLHDTYNFEKYIRALSGIPDRPIEMKIRGSVPFSPYIGSEMFNLGYKYIPDLQITGYSNGKSPIHIKPANRGKLTRLKARTGKSESELYNDGNPAHKKMVVFARNARKWKH